MEVNDFLINCVCKLGFFKRHLKTLKKPMIFNFYFSVSELICKWILTVLVGIAGSESTSTWQEGNKKREDGKRDGSGGGGGERLLKGGNYFKYFHLKGVII